MLVSSTVYRTVHTSLVVGHLYMDPDVISKICSGCTATSVWTMRGGCEDKRRQARSPLCFILLIWEGVLNCLSSSFIPFAKSVAGLLNTGQLRLFCSSTSKSHELTTAQNIQHNRTGSTAHED